MQRKVTNGNRSVDLRQADLLNERKYLINKVLASAKKSNKRQQLPNQSVCSSGAGLPTCAPSSLVYKLFYFNITKSISKFLIYYNTFLIKENI